MAIKNNLLLAAVVCLFAYPVLAQNTKGMYVNDFKNIIGDLEKETELLTYAQQEGFNYLLLYNMYWIHKNQFDLTDPVAAQPLASFIERAKTEYGILEVGAVGEKLASFDKMVIYNENFSANPNQQFDIFNIEFEFWNKNLIQSVYCSNYLEDAGLKCNKTGAFKYYIEEMKGLHELCSSIGIKSETYIGQIKTNQGKAIGKHCDRVLVHYYRKSDTYNNGNSLYNFKGNRLKKLAPKTGKLKVLPIFAATPAFMGPWLTENSTDTAFDTYMNGQSGYNDENATWKGHIEIDGFQWYTYTHLLDFTPANAPTPNSLKTTKKSSSVSTHNQHNHVNHNNNSTAPPSTVTKGKPGQLNKETKGFNLYPNPAKDKLYLQCPTNATIRFLNIKGELLKELSPDQKKVLDVAAFANGIYFVSVQVDGEEPKVQKVVVAH